MPEVDGNLPLQIQIVRPVSKGSEPPRVFRRLFRLSHAAKAGSTSLA
jgi:hypothetical protein